MSGRVPLAITETFSWEHPKDLDGKKRKTDLTKHSRHGQRPSRRDTRFRRLRELRRAGVFERARGGEGHVVLIAAVEDGGLPQSRDSRGHSRRGTQQPARPCHAVAHVRLRREGERDVRSARQGPEHAKADYDAARRQGTSRRASSRYASRWPGSAPSTSTWQASGRTTCSSKTGWAI